MKIEDFEALTKKRFAHCAKIMLGVKNTMYSRNNDKFHNFKEAGRQKKETPERALMGMAMKQRVWLDDMINDIDKKQLPTLEDMQEKITDMINYYTLLEGLVTERINKGA